MSYHKLKETSAQEIGILLDAIGEIRKDQEKQMKEAGHKQETIGF